MRLLCVGVALLAAAALAGTARADWSAELTTHAWNDSPSDSCDAGVEPGRTAGGWFEWRFVPGEASVRCPRTVSDYTEQHAHGPIVSFRVVGMRMPDGELVYGDVVTGRVAADGSVTWAKPASSLITIAPGEKYELILYVDWGLHPTCTSCK
jgi:hypothetical protein